MDLQAFYASIGVDYRAVIALLRKEERIRLYLVQTMGDPSFAALDEAMARRDWQAAFRAAHTVKGMSMNLMLQPLSDAAIALVECLRGGDPDEGEAAALYGNLKACSDEMAAQVKDLA